MCIYLYIYIERERERIYSDLSVSSPMATALDMIIRAMKDWNLRHVKCTYSAYDTCTSCNASIAYIARITLVHRPAPPRPAASRPALSHHTTPHRNVTTPRQASCPPGGTGRSCSRTPRPTVPALRIPSSPALRPPRPSPWRRDAHAHTHAKKGSAPHPRRIWTLGGFEPSRLLPLRGEIVPILTVRIRRAILRCCLRHLLTSRPRCPFDRWAFL